MKVYNHGSYGRGTLIVTPGADHPENSEWIDPKTKAPKQIIVAFKDSVAEVDNGLGRYLVDKKLAKASPIIARESAA